MEKKELRYPTAIVLSLLISLPLAFLPVYLGLMIANPLFLVGTFLLSLIGSSLGYATQNRRWMWFGAIAGAILPVGAVLAFILLTLGTH